MGDPNANLPEHRDIEERIASLFAVDCVRMSRILETAQYGLIFAIIAFFVGLGIDWLFRPLYPKPTDRVAGCKEPVYSKLKMAQALGLICLQVMIAAVSIIYVRKLGEIVPFFLNLCPEKYVPHWKVHEVEGELAIALVFVGVQTTLIEVLGAMRRSIAYTDCAWGEG